MDSAIRQMVRSRAAERCEYCRLAQTAAPVVSFHLEHVVPRQHGGSNDGDNLAWACPHCNRFKGPNLTSLDPETGQLVSLFNPRTQEWKDHFAINGSRIVGLTTSGRATVRLLRMNAEERLKVREELSARGEL
jgi:hypothetical protein